MSRGNASITPLPNGSIVVTFALRAGERQRTNILAMPQPQFSVETIRKIGRTTTGVWEWISLTLQKPDRLEKSPTLPQSAN